MMMPYNDNDRYIGIVMVKNNKVMRYNDNVNVNDDTINLNSVDNTSDVNSKIKDHAIVLRAEIPEYRISQKEK